MNPFYNKKKKGYTLAEVLATVAILLILMAIAVPAIFSIRKNSNRGVQIDRQQPNNREESQGT